MCKSKNPGRNEWVVRAGFRVARSWWVQAIIFLIQHSPQHSALSKETRRFRSHLIGVAMRPIALARSLRGKRSGHDPLHLGGLETTWAPAAQIGLFHRPSSRWQRRDDVPLSLSTL